MADNDSAVHTEHLTKTYTDFWGRPKVKALDDLSGAIAQRESVEGYFARAKTYEAQNNSTKATQDYRRATGLGLWSWVFGSQSQHRAE